MRSHLLFNHNSLVTGRNLTALSRRVLSVACCERVLSSSLSPGERRTRSASEGRDRCAKEKNKVSNTWDPSFE
jgi:hypothetical protein